MDIVHPLLDGFLAGGWTTRAWHVEERSPEPYVVLEIEDPFVGPAARAAPPRAIAGTDTRRAIL